MELIKNLVGGIGKLVGGIAGGKEQQVAQAEQPDVGAAINPNSQNPGTVKMEVPAQLAGKVAQVIDANA